MSQSRDAEPETTVIVCETCAWPDGEKLKDGRAAGEVFGDAVAAASGGAVRVARQACLMNCSQPCTAAVVGAGKISYVLGRFEPTAEAAQALVDYALGHRASDSGAVPFRTWPQGVKGKFIARIPPIEPD